jgi:hypothetical protein
MAYHKVVTRLVGFIQLTGHSQKCLRSYEDGILTVKFWLSHLSIDEFLIFELPPWRTLVPVSK